MTQKSFLFLVAIFFPLVSFGASQSIGDQCTPPIDANTSPTAIHDQLCPFCLSGQISGVNKFGMNLVWKITGFSTSKPEPSCVLRCAENDGDSCGEFGFKDGDGVATSSSKYTPIDPVDEVKVLAPASGNQYRTTCRQGFVSKTSQLITIVGCPNANSPIKILSPSDGTSFYPLEKIILNWKVVDSNCLGKTLYIDRYIRYPSGNTSTRIGVASLTSKETGAYNISLNYTERFLPQVFRIRIPKSGTCAESFADVSINLLRPQLTITGPTSGKSFYIGDSIKLTWTGSPKVPNGIPVYYFIVNDDGTSDFGSSDPFPPQNQIANNGSTIIGPVPKGTKQRNSVIWICYNFTDDDMGDTDYGNDWTSDGVPEKVVCSRTGIIHIGGIKSSAFKTLKGGLSNFLANIRQIYR